MRILCVTNHYQQRGGEDEVFDSERELLESHGQQVSSYVRHNDEIPGMNKLLLAASTLWNTQVHRGLAEVLRRERPDVVHFHNTFPLISPAAYYAVRSYGAAVVQTLHNYRLICPNALFLRQERVCEDCMGKMVPWPGVFHACYRESRAASAVTALMLATHRLLGTWSEKVDIYIALTEFEREKFIDGGLPADKVVVKPNFAVDVGMSAQRGGYALFFGRLSANKGVETLLRAWERELPWPLTIVGQGPLYESTAEAAARMDNVRLLKRQPRENLLELLRHAECVIFPSLSYEGFPRTIVEAYAAGVPVIASRIGSMTSLIEDGVTGLHFEPGDPADLAEKVRWAFTHPDEMRKMRAGARAEYEQKYTAERNYARLIEIYNLALQSQPRRQAAPAGASQTALGPEIGGA